MNTLNISVDKLPRILRRELDPGADALNGWEEDEIPVAPKLKRSERGLSKPKKMTAEEYYAKTQEDNRIDSFRKSSALADPLFTSVELTPPKIDPVEIEKYEKWIKPKLLKFLWIIREGLHQTDAALIMGWDPKVVEGWIANNQFNLDTCIKTAKLEHKMFHVSRTNAAGYGYQASTWMLERRYKDEYSKEVKITTKTENENSQVIKFGDREIHF